MQIKQVNKFSLNALFNAIPPPFSMDISLVIKLISFSGIFKKSPNILFNLKDNSSLYFLSFNLK